MRNSGQVAVIKGDGIGVDVTEASLAIVDLALEKCNAPALAYREIKAGANYYSKHGVDIEPGGDDAAGECDAIFLGAIGLPSVRYEDGTEISPHLRLRDKFGLYAGVRPVKAYPNAPQKLADPRAANIDLVILRESTEGLFYSAAIHNRSIIKGDEEVQDILSITRSTTEKLHRFAFNLAQKRKAQNEAKGQTNGRISSVTCVDKANVFASMAFFRKIFDEIKPEFPGIDSGHAYVDAQALDLIRRPWDADVLVMENMFGDILSDLAGGLVGGMGMAACAEIGDTTGLFQPAHGSAPDIMGQDKANPLAAILSGALMLDYLADKLNISQLADAAQLIENSVDEAFAANELRPMEFGGDMGTISITETLMNRIR